MKIILIFLGFIHVSAVYAARNPRYEIFNLHSLFSNIKIVNNFVISTGADKLPLDQQGEVGSNYRLSNSVKVPIEEFKREQKLGNSVFMNTRSTSNSISSGTVFAVGPDHVLTNFHVYSKDFRKGKNCNQFYFTLNTKKSPTFQCDKLLKCDKELDYCLMEVSPIRKKYKNQHLSDYVEPLILSSTKPVTSLLHPENTFLAIGNAGGLGIQASQGKKIRSMSGGGKLFYHHATIMGGNSGGPLINEQDEVIGINVRQGVSHENKDEFLVSDKAYNIAVSIYYVLEDLALNTNIKKNILPLLNIR